MCFGIESVLYRFHLRNKELIEEFEDCRKQSIYILEAFRLTLFKRLREK